VGAVRTKIDVCRHTFKLNFLPCLYVANLLPSFRQAFYVHPVYKFTNVDAGRITHPGGPGVGHTCSRLI
jgi:hypothetical protein